MRLFRRIRSIPPLWRRIITKRRGTLDEDVRSFLAKLIAGAKYRGRARSSVTGRERRLFAVEIAGLKVQLAAKRTPGQGLILTGIRPAKKAAWEGESEEGDYAADSVHNMKLVLLKNQLERQGWTVVDNRDVNEKSKSRPDLSATKNGKRMLIEVDTKPGASRDHQRMLTRLEPGTRSLYYVIDPKTGQTMASSAYNPRPGTTRPDPNAWHRSRRLSQSGRGIEIDRTGRRPMRDPLDVQQANAVLRRAGRMPSRGTAPAPTRRSPAGGASGRRRSRESELAMWG
jgi:hypothetical protein